MGSNVFFVLILFLSYCGIRRPFLVDLKDIDNSTSNFIKYPQNGVAVWVDEQSFGTWIYIFFIYNVIIFLMTSAT